MTNHTTTETEAQNRTEPTLYDSMHDYVQDADISHYEHGNADKDAPEILIEAFQPSDDDSFGIDWDDAITRTGVDYVRVSWGEPEKSYLRVSALYDLCYARYILYPVHGSDYSEYISDGKVYETSGYAEAVDMTDVSDGTSDRAQDVNRI